jgi:hypothetical protein
VFLAFAYMPQAHFFFCFIAGHGASYQSFAFHATPGWNSHADEPTPAWPGRRIETAFTKRASGFVG